jgi:hypothetical protein
MVKSLRDRVQEFSVSLPLMEGRDKGEFSRLHGSVVTITDFGFMKDGDKQYVAFTIKEDDKNFYFGGRVLTDQLSQLEEEGYGADIRKEGLPVLFDEKKSKKKNDQGRYNTYTTVEFYPEGI